jgi:diphthine synthase
LGELTFIGLGLGPRGITLEGLEELRRADVAYLEYYTTPHEPGLLRAVEKEAKRSLVVVDRGFVEDGTKILDGATGGKVALAVPGDPMIATTHGELRARAQKRGISTKVVHAASIASAASSASGLHFYKFSRTITVTRETVNRLGQAYRLLHGNLLEGGHTLILLEYDSEKGKGVTPAEAIAGLLLAEASFRRGVVGGDTFALVLSRIGREDASVAAGTFDELSKKDFGEPPNSVVIPGRMHFTEAETVSAIFEVPEGSVRGNSDRVRSVAKVLVPRYVAKTKAALEKAKGSVGGDYASVLENVELYMKDAETHLADGDDALAMLSIGYAEGLLDSLGFSGAVKVEW